MAKFAKFRAIFLLMACLSLGFYYIPVSADSLADQAALQQQLQQIEEQIQQYQQQLNQTTAQKNTLANKIKQLKSQQAVLNLQIQATNLKITQIGNQISDNQAHATMLKNQMAAIIRSINQNDNYPFLYTLVGKQQLSDIFDSYENYAQISQGLASIIAEIKQANDQLTSAQQDSQNLLSIKVLQQTQLTGSVGEQNNLLQETKGREANYQAIITDTKAQAATIRSRLYQLLGISTQITFGDALKIAQWAQGATGIDPAFLLAVLTQESNLGKNVGTCNRPGDPPEKSWKVVMKPERDQQPFVQITSELGINPDITPVSCPMHDKNGNQIGWGGAMGPAQFIPSTWMGYKDKVATLTGHSPANPWDIRDAFAAAAIKLVAGGADSTYQGQWNAAMRYFSGGTNPAYRFYGDSVLATTAKYQNDINQLK